MESPASLKRSNIRQQQQQQQQQHQKLGHNEQKHIQQQIHAFSGISQQDTFDISEIFKTARCHSQNIASRNAQQQANSPDINIQEFSVTAKASGMLSKLKHIPYIGRKRKQHRAISRQQASKQEAPQRKHQSTNITHWT